MVKKAIIILTFSLSLNAWFCAPASAGDLMAFKGEYNAVTQGLKGFAATLNSGRMAIKKGQPYDESRDPVFQISKPASEGPQHGYFAVPIIVLGLAGILLYFSKND